jgi:hypothetical protein
VWRLRAARLIVSPSGTGPIVRSGSGSFWTLCSLGLPGPTGPEDVDGRVYVGVALVAAGQAREPRAAPVPSRDVSAVGTGSAGVAGVDGDDRPTGTFSLIGDHGHQLAPPGVVDTTI